jgi:hypothetical protein
MLVGGVYSGRQYSCLVIRKNTLKLVFLFSLSYHIIQIHRIHTESVVGHVPEPVNDFLNPARYLGDQVPELLGDVVV